MRICIVSDVHEFQKQVSVPDGDVFISCGDETFANNLGALKNYCDWVHDLPHSNKLMIFGNHSMNTEPGQSKRELSIKMVKDAGIHYLEDSSIVIDGLKFHGSPVQPLYWNFAWNRRRGNDIAKHWA